MSVTATPKAFESFFCTAYMYIHKISEVYMYLQMNGFN